MRVHAVPATVTVARDAQLADVVFADDRTNSDLVLFERRSAGSWRPVTAGQCRAATLTVKRALVHEDLAAEIDELYR